MALRTLVSWNVNGIRSIEKKGFLPWLKSSGFDSVSLQETKVSPETVLSDALKNPPGYTSYWDYAEKKGYSGVATYVKPDFAPLNVSTHFGDSILSKEGRMLELEYAEFYFYNIYFPNGGMGPERLAYKLKFYEHFLKYLQTKDKPIIFCGDVNTAHHELDLARPKQNIKTSGFMPQERAWLDRLAAAGFVDTFRLFHSDGGHYSWWDAFTRARDRNVGWRIDYFWVSEELAPEVKDAFILSDVFGSDHAPVGIKIEL